MINKGVCLDPNKKIAKTAVVNVPKEGDTIPKDVWEIMTLSCPFLQVCPREKQPWACVHLHHLKDPPKSAMLRITNSSLLCSSQFAPVTAKTRF
jgi:hypothetical protein